MQRIKILASVLLLACLPGCTAGCQNSLKHLQSGVTGLKRKITLYNATGKTIREWDTTAKVEDKGGTCYFLTSEGKAVIISGTFVIEEQ